MVFPKLTSFLKLLFRHFFSLPGNKYLCDVRDLRPSDENIKRKIGKRTPTKCGDSRCWAAGAFLLVGTCLHLLTCWGLQYLFYPPSKCCAKVNRESKRQDHTHTISNYRRLDPLIQSNCRRSTRTILSFAGLVVLPGFIPFIFFHPLLPRKIIRWQVIQQLFDSVVIIFIRTVHSCYKIFHF